MSLVLLFNDRMVWYSSMLAAGVPKFVAIRPEAAQGVQDELEESSRAQRLGQGKWEGCSVTQQRSRKS